MKATNASTMETFQLGAIRAILRPPGPCATILFAPYHPGEPGGSPASLLKAYVEQFARAFDQRHIPPPVVSRFMQPLQSLLAEPSLEAGTHRGRAILCSPTVFEDFPLTQPLPASCNLGSCFAIRKLADELDRPNVFYLLVLRKTGVNVLRCEGLELQTVSLPAGVPATLKEALDMDFPDHDLENRSSSGSSLGSMRRVRFGTGSDRDAAYLADYYKHVDRGVHEWLRDGEVPLILAGTQEDMAKYRAVNTYRNLAKHGIAGSLDPGLRHHGLLQQALAVLREESNERHAAVLRDAREHFDPARFSSDFDTILAAAFEGKVSRIYVNEGARKIGSFEWGDYQSWENEDLLNLAIVQTLLHHGDACVLPREMMPSHSAANAVLRF